MEVGVQTKLAAKVHRQDSLARFLERRPVRQELINKNILPTRSESDRMHERERIGHALQRRLSQRPTMEELQDKNILYSECWSAGGMLHSFARQFSDRAAMEKVCRFLFYSMVISCLLFRPPTVIVVLRFSLANCVESLR